MIEIKKKIPLLPFPIEKSMRISKRLRGISKFLEKMIPGLNKDLYQSEIDYEPVEYLALVLFIALFYSTIIGGTVTFLTVLITGAFDIIGPLVGVIFFFMTFYFLSFYPHITARRRMKELEKNLLFALRHLLIEVKSGIPLFDAMVGISSGYGELSSEFKEITRDISGGTEQVVALDKSARKNPSLYYRRALWQLVNAIRSGSDIANTLEAITNDFARKQEIEIRSYGQQLNPWTMLYMIVAVIIPSLGITFLIILTSFSGLAIPKMIFPLILMGLGIFQFFFMGFIKNKRPALAV